MGLRVVEFGEDAGAGYCGKLFARWGAEVVRVDLPTEVHDSDSEVAWKHRASDIWLHPGKRRVTVDYRTTEGREILHGLAAASDIIVAGGMPSELDAVEWTSLGDGDRLKVRAAITPFGMTGPRRDWAATEQTVLALGGYTHLLGDPDREPLNMPGHYPAHQSGGYAYTGALAAWMGNTPGVSDLDISMLEVIASLSQYTSVMWSYTKVIRGRFGNDYDILHPISIYPCKDGWFAINIVPTFWEAFTNMMGRPDLMEDDRFNPPSARNQNRLALDEIIRASFADKTKAEMLEMGQREFRVPTGIVFTLEEVLADPHLRERGVWQPVTLPDGSEVESLSSGFRYVGETFEPQSYSQPGADGSGK